MAPYCKKNVCLVAGTYAIEVFCAGGQYSGPLSSEAFDPAAVTVRKVSKYTVGEKFEFQSKAFFQVVDFHIIGIIYI